MDENNPSSCVTFLQHEAAYRSRLFKTKHKKKRLSAQDLLSSCIKLVDDYNCEALPDISPDDHAKIVMPTLNVTDTDDQIFLTQVLNGCCRYRKLLEVLIAKLFSHKSPSIQCVDQTLYTVLGYLVLIRLEELTFGNFRLEEKILVIKQQEKHVTVFKAFNLSTSQKKPTTVDENKAPSLPLPFKAKPSPVCKEGLTPTQKALEAVCKKSREKLAKFYSNPKNQPFHLHILERPSKFPALKEQVEAVWRMETEYIPPRACPCPDPPSNAVKLTTAAMLREHALYQKQLDEERQRLQAFEMDLRDDSDYKSWQEDMRSKDQLMENAHRRFTKAAVNACDQAAADARNAKVEGNQEVVKKVKEESQKLEALKEEFLVNLELFNRLRRENIQEGQKAIKSGLIKVAELKKERAQEIQAETTKLASICASERASELAKRKELIQKLHDLERESAQIIKKFDRYSTAGHGLLSEMSISDLQARLAFVKQAIKKEEEYRRVRIKASKEEV